MADKKLTYQMVSPGEAWNNFVNSKDGHNAAAVTPDYLDGNNSKSVVGNTPVGKVDSKAVVVKPKLFKEATAHQNNQEQKEKLIERGGMGIEK